MTRHRSIAAPSACLLASSLVLGQEVQAQLAGNALMFDGTNDLGTIADSASLHLGSSATIELWIRPTTPFSTFQRFVNKGDGAVCDSNRAFELMITPSSGREGVQSDFFTGDCTGWTELVACHTFLPGEWAHVAAVYDAAEGKTSLFINGSLLLEGTVSATGDPISQAIFPSTFPLILGSWNGSGLFYGGEMDELRIWSLVRAPADIAAKFNRLVAPDTAGLVGYWTFDEAIGDQHINDLSTFRNHGVLGDSVAPESNDPTRVPSTAPIVSSCPTDLDGDGQVGIGDLLILLAQWGPCPPICLGDINGDGVVNVPDLLTLLAAWGPCL